MDAADASPDDGVMIALLPMTDDWCKIDLPHMTLVYAGLKSDLQPNAFNELAKDAASIAMLSRNITLRVTGVEVFGDVEKVDVLRLQPTSELLAMRRMVEDWNASKHDFNPHCTIGPQGTYLPDVPRYIAFNRVYVGYGNENLTFLMKNQY